MHWNRLPTPTVWPLVILAALLLGGCLHNPEIERTEERTRVFDLLTEGRELKEQGDFLLARDVFLDALEISPRPVLHYEIANCYFQLGKYGHALEYYDEALAMAPDYSLAKAERRLAKAKGAGPEEVDDEEAPEENAGEPREGDASSAVTESAPAKEDAEPSATESQETGESAPEEEESSPESGDDTSVFSGLTQAFSSLGQEGEASQGGDIPSAEQVREVVFPELYEEQEAEAESLAVAAAEAGRAGRYDEAVRLWNRVLERTPDDVSARLKLAWAYQRSGRTQRAEEELDRAREMAPENPAVAFEKGNFHLAAGEREAAREQFQRVLEIDPEHLRAENNLGVLHLKDGEAAQAIEYFRSVLAKDPAFRPGWLNLALAQDAVGEPASEIVKTLENYVRLSPEISERIRRWMRELRSESNSEAPGKP